MKLAPEVLSLIYFSFFFFYYYSNRWRSILSHESLVLWIRIMLIWIRLLDFIGIRMIWKFRSWVQIQIRNQLFVKKKNRIRLWTMNPESDPDDFLGGSNCHGFYIRWVLISLCAQKEVNHAFQFVEGIWLHRKSRQIRLFFGKRPCFRHSCAT